MHKTVKSILCQHLTLKKQPLAFGYLVFIEGLKIAVNFWAKTLRRGRGHMFSIQRPVIVPDSKDAL